MRYGPDFSWERHDDRAAVFRVKRLEGATAWIPENGVEDREKLPHHGDEGDLLGSAMGSELVVEGPEKERRRVAVRAAMYSTARTDVRPPEWPCGHASDQSRH